MSADKLAKRYAKSLFDEVTPVGKLDVVKNDMDLLQNTIHSSRELQLFLKSPVISSDKKKAVLNNLFSDKVSAESSHLFSLLLDKGREGFFGEIAQAFLKMYNQYRNITVAKVTTAIPLDAETKAKIEKTILAKIGPTDLQIVSIVDPSIMGGFIIDLGDRVYNASVRFRLATIANELTQH
jgi:F-type H+-transporting ATPase subunit delta